MAIDGGRLLSQMGHFGVVQLEIYLILRYCVWFWTPQYKQTNKQTKNVKELEYFQKMATKLMRGLEGMSYKRDWGHSVSQVWRRPTGNLTAPWCALRGVRRERYQALLLGTDGRMETAQSCVKEGSGWAARNIFCDGQMVKHWDRLHREVVDAPWASLFNTHLDNTLINVLNSG